MKVDVRHVDDVIIVDLEGRLVMGVGDELLRDVMNELIAEDWKKILLNLRKVSIIDSSGIGEVVSGWKLGRRFGASVKLLRPAPQIQRTLRLTQLLPLLEVFDDEAEGSREFSERLTVRVLRRLPLSPPPLVWLPGSSRTDNFGAARESENEGRLTDV